MVGLAVAVLMALTGCDPQFITHDTLVAELPTTATPHVTNGNVRTVAVVHDVVVLGGDFTAATDPDGTPVDRRYLLAFDRLTGKILRDWDPQLDNEVYSVVAAPDRKSVYVGGRFNMIDGAFQLKVARLAIADGSRMPYQAGFNALVTTLAIAGDRLYVGGVFTMVQGRTRRFAGLDLETGVIDDDVEIGLSGSHRGGEERIWRIEPSPNGEHLVAVGNFDTVGGQHREQIVKLDTNDDGVMTVNPWSTAEFEGFCASFSSYVRDVSYSPDGTYFVVGGTGAKGSGLNGTCDSVTRWTNDETPDATHDWIEYSGGDSYYSIEVTGAAVYVGGHFRWSNNSLGTNALGPGAVVTEGIAALDPINGVPLSWNPGRDRGRAVWQMVATPQGLYVASDTDRIARYLYRGRIAFFPLAGGAAVPQPQRATLPLELDQYAPAGGGDPAEVVSRSFDGTTLGAPTTVAGSAPGLEDARAGFLVNGTLYTAHDDNTFQARSFDGSTLGAARTVDLRGLSAFADDLDEVNGMVYDNGRLYYTRANRGTLSMRYFSLENEVIGAERFDIASSSGGLSYQDVTDMVLAGEHVYYVDRSAGTLVRADWRSGGGIDPATRTTVAPAGAGGLSWTSTLLWARQGEAANQPPTARATSDCTGVACSFDASTATDDDGTIVSVAWDFGDGQTAAGPLVSHTYDADGTYAVAATVTDDDGATSVADLSVTVSALAPSAVADVTCADNVCNAEGSGSSDPDGSITDHAWDFGDGETATGSTVSHTYDTTGPYTVTLTVTDTQGLTDTATEDVEVVVPAGRGFVGVDAATNGASTTSQQVTVPATVREGDQLLIVATSNAPGSTALDAPAGWSRVLDGDTSNSRSAVFARTATAADPGSTVTVTTSVPARTDVVLAGYRDLVLRDLDEVEVEGYTTPSMPASVGDWVVSYWADKTGTTNGWTAPAGVTTRHSHAGTGAGHVSELLADAVATVAGPTPQLTATVVQPSTQAFATTLVLAPV